jgi:membrane protease YdiL (CAAX protease family)
MRQARRKAGGPGGALVPFLGLVFVAITVVGLTAVLQYAHLVDAAESPIGLKGLAAFLLLPFGALGLAVLAWVRFVERRSLSMIGLTNQHRMRTFLVGHLTGILMVIAIVAGIWITGCFAVGGYAIAFHSPAALGGIVVLLGCFALQSSVEEILFRGWMLSAIANKFGIVIAITLSSVAFTIMHYDPRATGIFAINVLLFAVFTCCWALGTGNIWGVMGFHSGWNCCWQQVSNCA